MSYDHYLIHQKIYQPQKQPQPITDQISWADVDFKFVAESFQTDVAYRANCRVVGNPSFTNLPRSYFDMKEESEKKKFIAENIKLAR